MRSYQPLSSVCCPKHVLRLATSGSRTIQLYTKRGCFMATSFQRFPAGFLPLLPTFPALPGPYPSPKQSNPAKTSKIHQKELGGIPPPQRAIQNPASVQLMPFNSQPNKQQKQTNTTLPLPSDLKRERERMESKRKRTKASSKKGKRIFLPPPWLLGTSTPQYSCSFW
jgi:hypothetical protein